MTRTKYLLRVIKTGLLVVSLCMVYVAVTYPFPQNEQYTAMISPNTEARLAVKPDTSKDNTTAKDVPSKVDLVPEKKQVFSNTAVNKSKSTNFSLIPGMRRVRGISNDIFLFSVVLGNSSTVLPYDSIVIQGLENTKYKTSPLSCCIKYKTGSVETVNVTRMVQWTSKPKSILSAKQYTCPRYRKNDSPIAVTLSGATKMTKCHQKYELYMTPHYAQEHKKEIAVCTKLVSSDVDPNDILSWFELHRRLGVDKFVAYTYNLNPEATKVLQYYETKKLAETHPISLPKINQEKKLVEYGSKIFEAQNVEQTLIYDCFERLKGYKYLVLLDIDEYLVPYKVKRLPALFEKLWKTKPSAAGFSFLVHLHITSGKVSKLSAFTAGKYTMRTAAMEERMKHVTIPVRLDVGGLSAHSFSPKKGFKGFHVARDEATIHHFRACGKSTDWQTEMDKTCQKQKTFTDTSVANMLAPLEKDIKKLRFEILRKG